MKGRLSNFELLRIIAMILIVFHHIFVYCINKLITNQYPSETIQCFMVFKIVKRFYIAEYAAAFGKVGNILFVLLTGYFLIDKTIDITIRIMKIITQMFFATLFISITSLIHLHFEQITFSQSFTIFNDSFWFAGYYIIIIVIAKCFLNNYVSRLKKQEFLGLLLILFSFVSIGYIRDCILKPFGLNIVLTGVFLYLTGGFIKIYNPLKNVKISFLFLVIVFGLVGIGLNYYIVSINTINYALQHNLEKYNQVIGQYAEHSLPCLMIGISLFEVFKRITIKNNNVINYISASTFIIYCIHDNNYTRNLFCKLNWLQMLYQKKYIQFIISIVVIIIFIFFIGIIVFTIQNSIMGNQNKDSLNFRRNSH